MSDNGSLPASPVPLCPGEHFRGHGPADGLTKREVFAALAMQGILANRTYDPPRRNKLDGMASDAVTSADMLLAALARCNGGAA